MSKEKKIDITVKKSNSFNETEFLKKADKQTRKNYLSSKVISLLKKDIDTLKMKTIVGKKGKYKEDKLLFLLSYFCFYEPNSKKLKYHYGYKQALEECNNHYRLIDTDTLDLDIEETCTRFRQWISDNKQHFEEYRDLINNYQGTQIIEHLLPN